MVMIPNNLIHKSLKAHISVDKRSLHVALLSKHTHTHICIYMYKYTCVDTYRREKGQRTERHSNVIA